MALGCRAELLGRIDADTGLYLKATRKLRPELTGQGVGGEAGTNANEQLEQFTQRLRQ